MLDAQTGIDLAQSVGFVDVKTTVVATLADPDIIFAIGFAQGDDPKDRVWTVESGDSLAVDCIPIFADAGQ